MSEINTWWKRTKIKTDYETRWKFNVLIRPNYRFRNDGFEMFAKINYNQVIIRDVTRLGT